MTMGRELSAPPCRSMGAQCDSLRVLLRVATQDEGPCSADHEATWLLGHTERITFLGDLRRDRKDLYIEAQVQVPCRYLKEDGVGRGHCQAHGYTRTRAGRGPDPAEPRRLGPDRFRIVEGGRLVTRVLPGTRRPRELPVHAGSNPCVGAPCRTADNRRGAACCRDLQVEIMCTPRQRRLESLVRARQSPYLCKIERVSPFSLGAELISACGFLLEDGVHCSLHGRRRPDGRPAKPDLCSQWPEPGDNYHPGCVFRRAEG
ncbi:MAG TPA: hypothetical protein VGQ69_13900 [Gemmatimonadales bacterium]|nr:hypothetical protein [Gemmatimonadales bacterium]